MTESVDLTNLIEITGGDKEIESLLFKAFIEGSDNNISLLEENYIDGAGEIWQREAHSLKGAAKNIGAYKLADICTQAQESSDGSTSEKQQLFDLIKEEYEVVKEYLNSLL